MNNTGRDTATLQSPGETSEEAARVARMPNLTFLENVTVDRSPLHA